MIKKSDILVFKNKCNVIISFNGCRLIKPIDGFEKMSIIEITDLFWKEIGGDNK
jgi:hypothetical protein